MFSFDFSETLSDMPATQGENGIAVQRLPVDRQVPFRLGIISRLLLLLGMQQIRVDKFLNRITGLFSRFGFFRLWVFSIRNGAEQTLCLTSRLVRRPGRAVATNGNEPLPAVNSVLNHIDGEPSLSPCTEALHCLLVSPVPNGLPGFQCLNCPNRDASQRHRLSLLLATN